MNKKSLSGPAVFMYGAIFITAAASVVLFALYYGGICESSAVLWVGIVSFMILYHFGLRIAMGKVTAAFAINYNHPFFRQRAFEKRLYKILRVRRWKDKVLTFEPELYSFEKRTLPQLAATMAKSETDHWINEIISVLSMAFAALWGELWIFALTAVLAMLFDAQFIVVQRYNRPIVLKLMKIREKRAGTKQKSCVNTR